MSRCTGHCCERFFLSPDATDKLLVNPELMLDGVQVQQMLLPTGEEDRWTCVNFDTASRNCKIYEDRPNLCSSHPTKECPYEGCTLSGEDLE